VNTSEAAVVQTKYIAGRPLSGLGYGSLETNSPAEAAARQAVIGGCVEADYCILHPGDIAVAIGKPPVSVNISVHSPATVEANVARAAFAYIADKLQTPPNRAAALAANCASGASETFGEITTGNWDDAVFNALTGAGACKTLYKDIFGKPQQEVRASEEILGIAKSINRGLWIDFLKYGVTRVVH